MHADIEEYGAVEGIARNVPYLGDIVTVTIDLRRFKEAFDEIQELEANNKDARYQIEQMHKKRAVGQVVVAFFKDLGGWALVPRYDHQNRDIAPDLSDAINDLVHEIDSAHYIDPDGSVVPRPQEIEAARDRFRQRLIHLGYTETLDGGS